MMEGLGEKNAELLRSVAARLKNLEGRYVSRDDSNDVAGRNIHPVVVETNLHVDKNTTPKPRRDVSFESANTMNTGIPMASNMP